MSLLPERSPHIMPTYISMLRGINVGGQKKVPMAELSKLYDSLGVSHVKTYIQSGNVIFDSPSADIQELSAEIQRTIKNAFGFDVPVFIRTIEEFTALIQNNPFPNKDLTKLHVTFLSSSPASQPIQEIDTVKDELEEFLICGKEIYLFCPNGYGQTKLTNNFFEKNLKVLATTRNWNSVNKLLSMAK
jgi:uncharacterized protein (DUF1697 family)